MAELLRELTAAVRLVEQSDLFTAENIKTILLAGIKAPERMTLNYFVTSGHDRTGHTASNITASRRVRRGKDGKPYMFVTIRGKDERGQAYGAKGFVLNSGRSETALNGRKQGKIVGDRWWSDAIRDSRKESDEAMVAAIEEILKGAENNGSI